MIDRRGIHAEHLNVDPTRENWVHSPGLLDPELQRNAANTSDAGVVVEGIASGAAAVDKTESHSIQQSHMFRKSHCML